MSKFESQSIQGVGDKIETQDINLESDNVEDIQKPASLQNERDEVAKEIKDRERKITELSNLIDDDAKKLDNIRAKIGSKNTEVSPNAISSDKKVLDELRSNLDDLSIRQEDIERRLGSENKLRSGERLVRQEKEDEFVSQDIRVGDKVFWQGDEWLVYSASEPSVVDESDNDFNYRMLAGEKDPDKEPKRKIKNRGLLTLVRTNGNFRDIRAQIRFEDVEKITPENKARLARLTEKGKFEGYEKDNQDDTKESEGSLEA